MGLMWTPWIQLSLLQLVLFFVHREQVSSLEAAVKLGAATFCLAFFIGKAASSPKKLSVLTSRSALLCRYWSPVGHHRRLRSLILLINFQPVIKSNGCVQFVQSILLVSFNDKLMLLQI